MTGKLTLVNHPYWDCDINQYLVRRKNCHRALAEGDTSRRARISWSSPVADLATGQGHLFWHKTWREPHIYKCWCKIYCVREWVLLCWWIERMPAWTADITVPIWFCKIRMCRVIA